MRQPFRANPAPGVVALRGRTHEASDWLLACGIVLFALYVAMDVIASVLYEGYSYRDQTISELSAIDAPTRTFWLVCSVAWQALYLAFAVGVIRVARSHPRLRVVAWLLLVAVCVNFLWWVAPMHRREVLAADGGDWRDTLHLVLAGANTLLFFSTIAFGAFSLGRRFRWFSFALLAVTFAAGFLMSFETPDVAKNEPTPWLGIWERIAVEGAFLWYTGLALALLLRRRRA